MKFTTRTGAGAPWHPVRALRVHGAAWFARANYTRKWLVLGTAIGLIAGAGAVTFYNALRLSSWFFLKVLVGYSTPTPYGEGNAMGSTHFARPWLVPVVAALGAMLGAILVVRVAPEAEGHGTDAAIAAVHYNPRGIRFRTVVVKIIASALTIGSGGSGGREGPTGQISAGFGSFLSRFFDLSPNDARLAVSAGIGSGIGAIFGAPLAGSILATEIMYRDDFEVDALLPSFIASVSAYGLWGSVEGFGPLFGYAHNYHLANATQFVWFAVLGVIGGFVGLGYAKGFYGLANLFSRSRLPKWLRPALGGLCVGLIALEIPQVLGTGYGWIQQSLGAHLLAIPLWIVLVVPVARVLATGLSIGSGGSGGIFGPGMVIGAFVGASLWRLVEPLAPSVGHSPAPFVIVGMMTCFGGISRAPLAVMLMVAEMTGSLSLVLPAMVSVGLATLIVRRADDSIYRSQLRSRADAPAHRLLVGLPLLAELSARDAVVPTRCVLHEGMSVEEMITNMRDAAVVAAPYVRLDDTYAGVVELASLEESLRDHHAKLEVVDVAPVAVERHLDVVLDVLMNAQRSWVPVVDQRRGVIGTLSFSDLVRGYQRGLTSTLRRAQTLSGAAGVLEIDVEPGAALVGHLVRGGLLPRGLLITAIERGRDVLTPSGELSFEVGDRLIALGGASELAKLRALASSVPESRAERPSGD
ncbi:MAG: chloride channel protein [Acidobacteriota bacterium]|nr:chloride channel protein [Acidobacteriota bacterium]